MELTIPKKIDQYRKIREMALAGKLGAVNDRGSCAYRLGALRCGVGALFNDALLDDIEKRFLTNTSIDEVAQKIGIRNIETVTGFSVNELVELQGEHDEIFSRLRVHGGDMAEAIGKLVSYLDCKINHLSQVSN